MKVNPAMRTVCAVAFAVLGSVPLLAADKAETDARPLKVRAAEQKELVDRYAKSVATVRYFVRRNEDGEEPKFEIPYKCPNCSGTHWRDSGVSVDDEIPAEFAGYVIAPDEVMLQDVFIDPAHVARIEVVCAGETVAAVESEACPDANALVLKTVKPLGAAVPLRFSGGGEPDSPRYFSIVRETGAATFASLKRSNAANFRRFVELGIDLYEGIPNTIVLDERGEAITLAYQRFVRLGEELFDAPSAWRREPAAARFERKRAFEKSLLNSVLPVYVQLESPAKEDGRSSHLRFSSDKLSGNDIDTILVCIDGACFLPIKLGPAETARIAKMEATLPDGTKAPLEFAGSYRDCGGIAVRFSGGKPAGLVPLALDVRPAIDHFWKTARVAVMFNKGGTIEAKSGEFEVFEFERGKGNSVRVVRPTSELRGISRDGMSVEANKAVLMLSDRGVIAVYLENRRDARRWRSETHSIAGDELVELVKSPKFDAENVPRSAKDRKRTPWLGVEVQIAGADVLREKKALSYFSGYDVERAALVTSVASNSPAAKLGIAVGDVLLSAKYPGGEEQSLVIERDYSESINWSEVFDDERYIEIGGRFDLTPWPNAEGGVNGVLAEHFTIGSEIVVAWVSAGKRKEGRCALALAPVHFRNAPRTRNKELGMSVCDMTDEVRKYFKFDASAPGVVVTKVKSGGVAAVAGIRPLELILDVNGEDVANAKDFLAKTKGKSELTFNVRRLTATRVVPVKLR